MNTQDFTKFAGVEQMEAAVKTSNETFAKAFKAAKETGQKFWKAGADAVAKGYDKAASMTREQVEKTFPQAVSKFDEAAQLGKENIDAMFAAGVVAQKGFESIADELAAFNQKSVEAGMANTKALFGVKSYQEMVEIQSTIARSLFDNAVAGTTKFSELAVKVANEVAEPFQSRVTKVMEKYGKPLAA
jgi:phasin family protein